MFYKEGHTIIFLDALLILH